MIKRLFIDHPAAVNESYLEHMGVAASFGAAMLLGALGCFVHAVVPGLCVKTGSGVVTDLHRRMVTHRAKNAPSIEQGGASV
ncbi:hypothetical protein DDF62_22335 [Caulobacter radicis]|uniref:DUF6356 family protein n=1 Tax=Caulobacter radicis TaxID=2172650 RepID=UPI000D56E4CB|nr:DUF6356 family protein [Caulobacter radicis]PVM84471.1 hypothetical protein DDF62_22335 [Caulobacter radicis]